MSEVPLYRPDFVYHSTLGLRAIKKKKEGGLGEVGTQRDSVSLSPSLCLSLSLPISPSLPPSVSFCIGNLGEVGAQLQSSGVGSRQLRLGSAVDFRERALGSCVGCLGRGLGCH